MMHAETEIFESSGPVFGFDGKLDLDASFQALLLNAESARAEERLRALIGDWLAETYQVWDCEDSQWITDAPTLFRFEGEDVVINLGSESTTYWFGSIDLKNRMTKEGRCPQWLRRREITQDDWKRVLSENENASLSARVSNALSRLAKS